MAPGAGPAALLAALEGLGEQVAELRLPLDVAGADQARTLRRETADQLDDYVLPRLRRLDAPLLAVVGGPTGAGKSTLVNSLVGARVSAAGVLRPTTRSAVIAYHPTDNAWFEEPRILPGLTQDDVQLDRSDHPAAGAEPWHPDGPRRARRPGHRLGGDPQPRAGDPAARRGGHVAVRHHGGPVRRCGAVGVPAARGHPRDGGRRACSTACRRRPSTRCARHLAAMLTEQGLGGAPLFVVPETVDVRRAAASRRRRPGAQLAARAGRRRRHPGCRRAAHAGRGGALAGSPGVHPGRCRRRAGRGRGAPAQGGRRGVRRRAARRSTRRAATGRCCAARCSPGGRSSSAPARSCARWSPRCRRVRDRVTAAVQGKPAPGKELAEALESGVEALVRVGGRRRRRAGRDGLGGRPGRRPAARRRRPAAVARRSSPRRRRARSASGRPACSTWCAARARASAATARFLAFGVNGLGLMVMIVVFAHTGGLVAGEVAVAGGASALSQKVLEAVLGDQAVRSLAEQARRDLADAGRAAARRGAGAVRRHGWTTSAVARGRGCGAAGRRPGRRGRRVSPRLRGRHRRADLPGMLDRAGRGGRGPGRPGRGPPAAGPGPCGLDPGGGAAAPVR